MLSAEDGPVIYEQCAVDFAFDMGQRVERMLLDRAMEQAQIAATSIVTRDHVQAAMNELFGGRHSSFRVKRFDEPLRQAA